MDYSVYGVSDSPEEAGKEFTIFYEHQFQSIEDAVEKARQVYSPELKVIVRWTDADGEEQEETFEPEEPEDGEETGE